MKKATSSLAVIVALALLYGCSGVRQDWITTQATSAIRSSSPMVIATTSNNWANTNKPIWVAFSQAMDPATINTQTFRVAGISGSIRYDARHHIAYFHPSTELAMNASYLVTVTDRAKARSGESLPGNFQFMVRTRNTSGGLSPPTVTLLPTCPLPEGPVRVRFSEAMDSTTIIAANIFIEGVEGTVTYNALTRVASVFPVAPLEVGETYTLVVTTGVKDLGGVALEEEARFEFQVCPRDRELEDFCTFTKGGYSGPGQPGQLLNEHWTTLFPEDLVIGIDDGDGSQHHHRWTANQAGLDALRQYLLSPALGASAAFQIDATNPTATHNGNLPTQVATLSINIAMSGVGTPAGFGDLILQNTGTSLDGASVTTILAVANNALAGNGLPEGYTFSQLNDLVTSLNEAFADCFPTSWAEQHLRMPNGD